MPLGAFKVTMLGAAGTSGSRDSWFLHYQGASNEHLQYGGHGLDTSDNIFVTCRTNSGYNVIAKIDGGDVPSLLSASNRSSDSFYDQITNIASRQSDGKLTGVGRSNDGKREAVYQWTAPTTSSIANPTGTTRWYRGSVGGNANADNWRAGPNMMARKIAAGNSDKYDVAWNDRNIWGQVEWSALSYTDYYTWPNAFYGSTGAEFIRNNVYHDAMSRNYIGGMHDSYSRFRLYGYSIGTGSSTRRRVDLQTTPTMSCYGGLYAVAPSVGSDKFGYFCGANAHASSNTFEVVRLSATDSATTDCAVQWSRTLSPGTTGYTGMNTFRCYANPACDSAGNVYVAFGWIYSSGSYMNISRINVDGTLEWSNNLVVTASGGLIASDSYIHNVSVNSNDDVVISGRTNLGSTAGDGSANFVARLASDGTGTGSAITLSGGSSPGGTVHYYDNASSMNFATGSMVATSNTTHDINYSASPSDSVMTIAWTANPITTVNGTPLV